jgi:hypothetical protein
LTIAVVLDRDSPCDIRAVGPIGRAGLQIVTGTSTGPGLYTIALPEEGSWEFSLACGRDEHAVVPAVVTVTANRQEVRLMVR